MTQPRLIRSRATKRCVRRATPRGGVLVEMFMVFVVLGLVVAVAIPQLARLRREQTLHACAGNLDRGATPEQPGRCPATGAPYVREGERRCCPNPREHRVEALCTGAGSLAERHPAPSLLSWAGWGLAAVIPGGILAFVFIGNLVMALRPGRRRRGRGF